MKKLILLALLFVLVLQVEAQKTASFIQSKGKTFSYKGKPYYFIGTNYWYGAILASTGEGGDRQRLLKELDFLKKKGITNLRVLVGAQGPDDQPYRVTPALQLANGKYNEDLLDGLDFLLAEMGKRELHSVLYFQNSWEWSGGYSQYLNWNGYGPIPYPQIQPNTWSDFMKYAGQFHACAICQQQFREHVKFILSRKNKYNGVQYINDPSIMTWEIGNEPRAFSKENIPAFEKWLKETSAFIKSLDKNHLVTIGSEGKAGSEGLMELFESTHSDPNVDYLTIHIWPKNWGWLDSENIPGTVEKSIEMTNQYIDSHLDVARKLNKPLVLEEFGLPRDHHTYSLSDSTTSRDKYYQNAFERVLKSSKGKDALAGANFWAFGGSARPKSTHVFWKKGDELMGDPPQEEQGLNSVFDTDSSIGIIEKYSKLIQKAGRGK